LRAANPYPQVQGVRLTSKRRYGKTQQIGIIVWKNADEKCKSKRSLAEVCDCFGVF
jgi:hypothetical protein